MKGNRQEKEIEGCDRKRQQSRRQIGVGSHICGGISMAVSMQTALSHQLKLFYKSEKDDRRAA